MAKAAAFSPLRLFTPIQLIFCLVLFFLPWIEIQCVPPKELTKNLTKEQIDKIKKETGADPTKPRSLISQSGLQIATGGYSIADPEMRKAEREAKEKMKNLPKPDTTNTKKQDKEDNEPDMAPLLFVYPIAVLAGIVLGFILGPGMPRRLILAGCCGGALAIIGLQLLIGFPVENQINKQIEKEKKAQKDFEAQFGGGGGVGAKADAIESPFRVSWQFGLYLTFLLLLGAAATSFIDEGVSQRGKKKKKPVYDFDDDDDDDDDDWPRKKKKPRAGYDDDDDEDDDRPRKKKRRDEDDDARPAKKRRRDEEDEDDDRPPKKTKPPEPAFEIVPDPAPPPAAPASSEPNPFAFDDDEPKPKKKKPRSRDDDEDDDRPRRKRRRDDDDD